MKNIRYVLIVALLFSVGTSAIAQLKRANRRFDQLAYARAIFLYEKGLKKKSGNLEAMARLADCYRLTSDSKHAENWYKQVTKNRKSDPKNCFYYGQALMNNRKWEEASKWFEKYLDKKPGDKLAERALWSSKNHHEFVRDSSLYTVVPTNLNTAEADFGPSFYMDKELVFASARKPGRFEHSWTNRSFLDLYRADFSANRQGLGEAKRLDGQVNSKLHEGGQTFSSDGQVMFFSRNNFHRGKVGHSSEGVVRLKTFRADLKGGKWKNVTGIPFNDDEYSIGHPSLSSDGKTLYFVSDMPGGEGGTDLYKVKLSLKEELWGEPENLGPEINTSGNEMFPWISQDGHLYFASDGHEGLGGLDIFQVKNLAGNGIKVSNMGYPIN
ncbi:MAG TPA: hypothetical protein ENJ82_13880, partial [Bacteroidetes bacterium]|nr:hypothetical protein [Bacteroidota bacterium]